MLWLKFIPLVGGIFLLLSPIENLLSKETKARDASGKRTFWGKFILWARIFIAVGGIIIGVNLLFPNLFTHVPQVKKKALFKIVVLPFRNDGDKHRGYSFKLFERLQKLNVDDSLKLEIVHKNEMPDNYYATPEFKDSILEAEDADFLVWGSYTENENRDYLSLQYYSKKYSTAQENPAYTPADLVAFANGKISGKLEDLSYFLAAVANFNFAVSLDSSGTIKVPIGINSVRAFLKPEKIPYLEQTIHIIKELSDKSTNSVPETGFALAAAAYSYLDSFKQAIRYMVRVPIKLTTSGRSKLTTSFAGEDFQFMYDGAIQN